MDGDSVQASNLNRQNYVHADIDNCKTTSIYSRLKQINPNAYIKVQDQFIAENNILDLFEEQYDIAINALDFASEIPFLFDTICQSKDIPIIDPYNIGWAGLIFVVMPQQ